QSTTRGADLKRSPLKPGETSPWLGLLKSYGARIEIVPDTGHFTQLEAPQRVNPLIAEFCR
ncbi:MAG TPA: alpha/beta hydrolase, partial [Burkholderiales bacterium]|nr:alpha/beta hydrolase [Burkholderiales bacterium]